MEQTFRVEAEPYQDDLNSLVFTPLGVDCRRCFCVCLFFVFGLFLMTGRRQSTHGDTSKKERTLSYITKGDMKHQLQVWKKKSSHAVKKGGVDFRKGSLTELCRVATER